MSILVALHHVTHYRYDQSVALGMQTIRLRPAPHARTPVKCYSLKITPDAHFINWQQDPFGNFLAQVVFPEKVTEFKIEVDLQAEIRVFNPFDFFLEESAKHFPVAYDPDLKQELAPYLEIKEGDDLLLNWLNEFKQWQQSLNSNPQGMVNFLVGINQRLHQHLAYTIRMEPGVQSCEQTLQLKKGSCRDMAWLLCQILRHLGLASRFASGYLIQLVADQKSLEGPSGTEQDFTDLHAWTEVYLPGAGWIGLDPTSGLLTGEGHLPLCCTPNPSSAAPVTGTLEQGVGAELHHTMQITRVLESPRVTKPFTDAMWQKIDQLGQQVDQDLQAQQVRLSMGGEPTFVALDDREHNAWHFAALGANKHQLAKDLLHRLRTKFAPNGLVMHTQGKWYPGEILPRWAMPCFWRRDGQPVWQNMALCADPELPLQHTLAMSEKFLLKLAEKLGIPAGYQVALREDAVFYLWKARQLPQEAQILSADLYEQAERERLQSLLESNLSAPVAYALPLHYSHKHQRWISNKWQFSGAYAVLLTGDSPAGLRLPLTSLPVPANSEDDLCPERSTFAAVDALPSYAALKAQLQNLPVGDVEFSDDPNGLVRTALCAEVRHGILHVFLPPVAWLEHFLLLVVAIESVAAELNIAVILEGYTPPADLRLASFSVTPDPGVIEVNVQPAASWEELKFITETVYDAARLSRLSAEKFLHDGRRIGTGGGNHLVLGALQAEHSPFLRRPDLLRSLISFWQNHPSLSYLFAGLYIGPTSQAPRIDEARHDSLYELEIAFQQIHTDAEVPPWQVDRLLRNLLVDLSGNTHRAEFCIDKLFSPDSDRGRLGLLEMRGFEMTPHPQMNLLQALLVRACVAMFWRSPYQARLIRWGTRLHDQFMLPYYIETDLREVLAILRDGGYDFAWEWFAPFLALRFPDCGQAQLGETQLTVTTALEPWPVMGESASQGTVSRSVDATLERVQVKIAGFNPQQHILICNGRRIPLRPTAINDTYVAGVRFKAWSQPISLHPQLPVNAPLTFELLDQRLLRSMGGCTYHVVHPGGRSYATYPVNENEAEGRRLSRFEVIGHSAGQIQLPPIEQNDEFAYTLDLRFCS